MKKSPLLRHIALPALLALSACHSAPTRAQAPPPPVSPVLGIINGGTGATTAAQARTNLGLGAIATHDTIDINSGFITGNLGSAQLPGFTGDVTSTAGTTSLTIAVSAVTTGKIADAAVTAAKLAPGAVIGNLGYTPVNPTDDFSQFTIFPTGSPDPVVLADVGAAALNGLHVVGTIAPNHVLIGGAGPNEVLDSGATFCNGFSENFDPGPAQDYTQGYCDGSSGINKITGTQFVAVNVDTLGSAVWRSTSSPLAAPIPYPWTFASMAASATQYTVSGSSGSNTNTQAIAVIGGKFSTLRARIGTAPGVGNSLTITLQIGTDIAMSDTALSCVIANTDTHCTINPAVVAIAAGQSYTFKEVTSAGVTATGLGSVAVLFTPGT